MDNPRSVWWNLRHWALYVPLNATAGFVWAYATDWHSAQAIVGMAIGITAYIALYTSVWSNQWLRRNILADELVSRALLYGTRSRVFMSFFGLLCLVFIRKHGRPANFFQAVALPDLWAGMKAIDCYVSLRAWKWSHVVHVHGSLADHNPWQRLLDHFDRQHALVPTFVITIFDGIFTSLMLLGFAAAWWLVLWLRTRWKAKAIPSSL